jgi:hypothetical protein
VNRRTRPGVRIIATVIGLLLGAGCSGGGASDPHPAPGAGGSAVTGGRGGSQGGRGGSSSSTAGTSGTSGSSGTGAAGGATTGGAGGSAGGVGGALGDAASRSDTDTDVPVTADANSADAADAPTGPPAPDAGSAPWTALTAGWTEKMFTFAIHKPFDLPESARHTFDAATNTHTFWTLRGDKPHQPPPNSTGARSELRMNNDYTSGNHQFEADVYVVSGTQGACVMQVFGGITNATSLMLVAHPDNGGSVKRYDGPAVIKSMAYDKWWHLNVIHEANGSGIGKVRVYADGVLAGTFDDRGNATHYFKCGVYNNSGARAESRFRNIKYWVK